jgi:hypothetical protein
MGIRYLLRDSGRAKDKKRNKDGIDIHMSHTFHATGLPDLLLQLDCSMNPYDAAASSL